MFSSKTAVYCWGTFKKIETSKINRFATEEKTEKKPVKKARSADDEDSQRDREELHTETRMKKMKYELVAKNVF